MASVACIVAGASVAGSASRIVRCNHVHPRVLGVAGELLDVSERCPTSSVGAYCGCRLGVANGSGRQTGVAVVISVYRVLEVELGWVRSVVLRWICCVSLCNGGVWSWPNNSDACTLMLQ
jgi:hypothetical protein